MLYLCLFFFYHLPLKAQAIKEKEIALITYLKQIETQYNVSFTYADSNLRNKTIIPPSKTLSLKALIRYLEEHTTLTYEKLSDGIYVVRNLVRSITSTTQALDEVIITNYLTKGIILKNGGITNLKPKTFGILPGLIEPDVLQTIQALPGIQSVDERVSSVNIRGGTHDQNLILWDGIKMYQSGHFFGLVSAFNPYLTDNVIISKNGSSAIYGDGVSSVIDMRSSNKIKNIFSSGAGINLISADAYSVLPLSKKTELQLSLRRSITDIIETPTFDQYFKRIFQDSDLTNNLSGTETVSQNETFYFYDLSAKFLYDISKKDKLRINFFNVYNNLDYEEQATINNTNEALNSELVQGNISAGVSYSRNWNSKFSTSAQLTFSNYKLDATNFDVSNNQRLIQENEVFDGSLKVNLNYRINPYINFLGGYQFTEVGISNLQDVNNPNFRSFIKEVLHTHSVFSEFKFVSNSKNTNASLGLRSNYFEKFSESSIEPRLSFSHRFLDFFRVEVLGELKSQTTSQIIDLQNDFLGVEQRRWVLSNNTTIPIIKSQQLSTGIHYSRDNFLISLEAYIKNVDGITTRSQGFQNQFQFVNAIGSYQIKGVDFLINKKFEDLSIWLSYSYSKNDYTFDNLNAGESFPNNFDTRHTVAFAGAYTYNNFKLALGLNWRTGKPLTEPDTIEPVVNNVINYNSPNANNISDYLRVDTSATYDFKIGNTTQATLGLSLWNILDRENIINTYYTLNRDDSVSKVENFSLGITPNASFRIQF
ncbi:TonB-dependent receptor [Flavobacteriaceae bacterium AU392]|nr:TonB-dependent receptor [Flavobacteriaceae bacterium]RKM82936.1 TonB-dependent receptor [Flavobacteriaceae bacterium AU392]